MTMKKISVEIIGTTPLLMNSPKAMLEPKEASRKTTKAYNHEEEAEKVAYRNSKGILYVPSVAIKGSLINASAWKKAGKYALKPLIAAAVRIPEPELSLNTKTYEIDTRTVVIQHSRVVKARPVLKEWKLSFQMQYNPELIGDDKILKDCLSDAGERVGILDYRPQKLGEFGCFKVSKWQVE